MKLFYRGVSYDYAPGSQSQQSAGALQFDRPVQPSYNLMYRGAFYTVDPNVETAELPSAPIAKLIYRGVTYCCNGWAALQGHVAARPQVASLVALSELGVVHRENLYRNVLRRLQVAKAQGNDDLIYQLEQELHQIV